MNDKKDQSSEQYIKPTKPNIPEETKTAMAQFFMKTSIPRILAARQKERDLKGEENSE